MPPFQSFNLSVENQGDTLGYLLHTGEMPQHYEKLINSKEILTGNLVISTELLIFVNFLLKSKHQANMIK